MEQRKSAPLIKVVFAFFLLIPVFDNTLQPRCDDLTRFLRMPLRTCDRTFASGDFMQHLCGLPIIETHESARIASHDKLAVRTYANVYGIPSTIMASEDFLAVLPEAVGTGIDDDLVVRRLEGDRFVGGVGGGAGKRVHVRFCDSFDGNRNANLPGKD